MDDAHQHLPAQFLHPQFLLEKESRLKNLQPYNLGWNFNEMFSDTWKVFTSIASMFFIVFNFVLVYLLALSLAFSKKKNEKRLMKKKKKK